MNLLTLKHTNMKKILFAAVAALVWGLKRSDKI